MTVNCKYNYHSLFLSDVEEVHHHHHTTGYGQTGYGHSGHGHSGHEYAPVYYPHTGHSGHSGHSAHAAYGPPKGGNYKLSYL